MTRGGGKEEEKIEEKTRQKMRRDYLHCTATSYSSY
jgi:hypothetical protein